MNDCKKAIQDSKIPRFYAKIQQKNKLAVIPANLKEK